MWSRISRSLEIATKRGPRALDRQSLEALASDYRAVVSDLASARAQGASDNLVAYLNELSGRAHGVLYSGRAARIRGLGRFLTRDFPRAFRETFRFTLAAALIFFASWGLAAYEAKTDPDVARYLMPEKIIKKDVGGEVTIPDPAGMSSFIVTNNIRVGIYSFAGGITAGAFTAFEMAQNGAMLGAVATLLAPVMGQARFWSYILPHGIIELVAIFICGGAGFMIGSSIIAPGNLRRSDAVRLASGQALQLFAGSLPFFVIAAIIEGFLTPSALPPWSKLTFAGVTAIGLVLYLGFAGGGREQSPNLCVRELGPGKEFPQRLR